MKKISKTSIFFISMVIALVIIVWGANYWAQGSAGPREVVLDKQVCHYCGMHVGDIRYAGQIQTERETFFYDDVGCLIHDKENIHETITAVYYHHYFEDRWIPEEKAAFIKVEGSPMGHNLAAIDIMDPEEVAFGKERLNLSQARIRALNTPSHGPNEIDSHGPNEMDDHGPNEMDDHGPNEMDDHGPNEMDDHGPNEMDDHGPNEMDDHGPNEMDMDQ